jgi:CHASE3 domain sensor protein
MKTREPLRSRAFRLLLVALVLGAFLGVLLSWRAGQRADTAMQTALARWQTSHELELQLERLHSSIAAADVAAETFLETWRSGRLENAAAAETAVRSEFAALRPSLALDGETRALVSEIESSLDERQANFTQLVEWTRAAQFNRVREWSEAHRDAIRTARLGHLFSQIQASQRATRAADRETLTQAIARNTRAARFSWIVQVCLAVLVLWLLWQYERTRRLVIMCAWTRTIQYEGEWLTFEDYLKRRFGLETTHGIRPDQANKILEDDDHAGPAA